MTFDPQVFIDESAEFTKAERMDVKFHALRAEHREVAQELAEKFTVEELLQLAEDMPFDQRAADAVLPTARGHVSRAAFLSQLASYRKEPLAGELPTVSWPWGTSSGSRPHRSSRRAKSDASVYVAAALYGAHNKCLEEILELTKAKLAKVQALKAFVTALRAKGADLCVAHMTVK